MSARPARPRRAADDGSGTAVIVMSNPVNWMAPLLGVKVNVEAGLMDVSPEFPVTGDPVAPSWVIVKLSPISIPAILTFVKEKSMVPPVKLEV